MAESNLMDTSKKLHVEITPINWERIEEYINSYNMDPERKTPKIKVVHVINEALDLYLSKKKKG